MDLDVDIDGIGLGLFISKEIVELHSGKILVDRKGEIWVLLLLLDFLKIRMIVY